MAMFIFLNATNAQYDAFEENKVTYVDETEGEKFLQKYKDYQFMDEAVVYRSDSQGYLVVFSDRTSIPNNSDPWDDNYLVSLLAVILLIVVVYITNLTLTRRIFRSIMSPIETLANGVRHIRDGDLTYRIEYQNNDEFDAVCSDFNEMAARLLDMVNQRQKDEQNQKELIAGISHDLRTPLTSIKSYVKGLRDGVAKSKGKEDAYLDIIYRKTCDMEKLSDQLFVFSQMETDSFPFCFKPVSIHDYIVALLDSLEYDLLDKHTSITLDSACQTRRVLLDGEQMKRVICNILENSVKHNQGREIRVDICLYQRNNTIILRIQDNGCGVSEHRLSRLFDLFYRGDEARSNLSSGSGLGLSIAKKIVAAHGGRITAENSGGLAMIIELPMEAEE
ncbi:MAG: HAMP domain-containing histidine kinase [Clostridiales Family XIII bacterium]|nr:HAMP domain-containing histidine kinase [Clostridiales Family XIII bacterium]